MRIKRVLTAILAVFVLAAAGRIFAGDTAGKPLTYEECAALALQNSNDHKAQSEKLYQANLARLKAIGDILPEISLVHRRYYGSEIKSLLNDNWDSSVSAVQPVFHGFDKIMTISEMDREAVKEEYNLKALERKIKEDTAAAFYSLASAQSDLINTQEAFDLMTEREKELRQREALGKSRLSELYSVQSSAAQLAAQLELAKSNVDAAADNLALLTGAENSAIIQPAETDDKEQDLKAADAALSLPEVKALEAGIEAEGRRVMEQQGTFLPQVDLLVSRPVGSSPYADGGWSFMLAANWLVFEGGARLFDTMSEYSKEEGLKQQRLALLKEMLNDVKARIRNYNASVKRVKSLKEAYEKSNKSFKLIQKDYRYGMATNIEVIQSMTDMTNVKKALDNEIITKEKNKILIEILK
jgi:outer membrane protein